MIMNNLILDHEYQDFLTAAKEQYKSAQLKAVYAVNREMIQFYWRLGKQLIESSITSKERSVRLSPLWIRLNRVLTDSIHQSQAYLTSITSSKIESRWVFVIKFV
jgi:hypothetical protein